ncbi:hypothetical protein LTR67_011037 [Exophiala xenobiotica]
MAGPIGPPIPLADSPKSPKDKASDLSVDTGEVGETETPPTANIITFIPLHFSGHFNGLLYSYADGHRYQAIPHQTPTPLSEHQRRVQYFRGFEHQGQPRPRSFNHENIPPWRIQPHSNQVYSANTSVCFSTPPSGHQSFEVHDVLNTAKAAHVQTGPIHNALAIVKTPPQPRLFLTKPTLPQSVQGVLPTLNAARHLPASEKAIAHISPAEVGMILGYFDIDPSGSQGAQAVAGIARSQTYVQRYRPGGETLNIRAFEAGIEMNLMRRRPFNLSMDLSTIVARRDKTDEEQHPSDLQGVGHQFENHTTVALGPPTTASQSTAATMYHHRLRVYHSVRHRGLPRPSIEDRPLSVSGYSALQPSRINQQLMKLASDDGRGARTFAPPAKKPEEVHHPPLFASESQPILDEKIVVDVLSVKARLPKSARQLLSVEIIKKILFLALHGIPSAAIAYEIHTEIPKIWKLSVPKRLQGITNMIDHYLVEIVAEANREGEAEDFISKLLTHALSKDWIPRSLQNAVEYIHSETAGDGTSGTEARRQAAKARIALQKWRSDHHGADPDLAPNAKGKRSSTDGDGSMPLTKRRKSVSRSSACQGLQVEMHDRQRLEELGYREGSLDTEKAMMNEWLEKLKKTKKLPSLMEAAHAAQDAQEARMTREDEDE